MILQKYNRVNFKDRLTEFPLRRLLVKNSDGTTDIQRSQGEVFEAGTPINARNLNNMDKQIYDLTNVVLDLIDDNNWLKINLALTQSFIGKPSDNTFMVTFDNATDAKINRGIYSKNDKAIMLNEYTEASE